MRFKHILLASAVLVSVSSFAQKDELKKLKKIYDKDTPSANELAEYKATLDKLAPLATEEGDKVYYNFYKANAAGIEIKSLGAASTPAQQERILTPKAVSDYAAAANATLEYEKKSGKKTLTDGITKDIALVNPMLINAAVSLGNVKKYKEAADVLYSVYQLDKKDQDKLFYAATYAVNGQDYDRALDYYTELKKLNYSGEGAIYWATNKATKAEENFNSKQERELFIKGGTHEKPRDEKIESKRGEIYKNIALILVEKGRTDEAKAAVADARKENPNDDSLILTEADLYLKVKDYDNYTRLVNDVVAKDPSNSGLLYNLGVISAGAGKLEDAENYYKKALAVKPDYFDANLNMAELIMRADAKFVTEMNKLGNSEKDNKRYDVLKAERNANFKKSLPYLEKAYELQPTNEDAKKTLMSVYRALEMTDKYNALKAK